MPKLEGFPELLTSRDLVALGLYPSVDAVYLARIRGHSPDYLKIGKKVLYTREKVLLFMEQNIKDGSIGKNTTPEII